MGHAFAALAAFDLARRGGGRFLLRIEDIDSTRCSPDYEAAIVRDLHWLGLSWPEPVRRQSERFGHYAAALRSLEEMELLYPCFCTRKEIAEEIARAAVAPLQAELSSDGPAYPGTCRELAPALRAARIATGAPYALRLDVARALKHTGALTFEEQGSGPNGETGVQAAQPNRFGDVVLARKELPASYHLAVVLDDADQEVTHVTRGCDLFAATHIQRLLQSLLGLATPLYAHHRLILDERGRKYSKRDRSVTLASLRESGLQASDVRARLGM